MSICFAAFASDKVLLIAILLKVIGREAVYIIDG